MSGSDCRTRRKNSNPTTFYREKAWLGVFSQAARAERLIADFNFDFGVTIDASRGYGGSNYLLDLTILGRQEE
jgi:hypothetical protein